MSKLVTSRVWRGLASRKSLLGAAVAAALALPQVAAAMEFDLGSSDLSFRWDNTIRVNLQDRVAGQNKDMMANPNYDDGDRNFTVGSKFERFDILSEADFMWKPSWGALGARVSAAGWWGPSYATLDNTSVVTSNNLDSSGYPKLGLPDFTKRYAQGPSGEFLDWFLFSKFNVGQSPVNIKLGQTTVYWGESLYFNGATHGINYGQNPIDVWKGLENPGAEAKELFRPRLGFNIQAQVMDDLSVAGQYFFNWQQFSNQAWRYPDSGSYLSLGDMINWGGKSLIYQVNPLNSLSAVPPGYWPAQYQYFCSLAGGNTSDCYSQQWFRFWRGKDITPNENSGNWGVAVRWSPEWVGGTLGFYVRETYDMQPAVMVKPDVIPGFTFPGAATACAGYLHGVVVSGSCLQNSVAAFAPSPPYPANTPAALTTSGAQFVNQGRIGTYNTMYGQGIYMFGMSLSRNVGDLSLGAELNYRHNMPLLSDPVKVLPYQLRDDLGLPLPSGAIWSDKVPQHGTAAATGDTLHGLVNLVGVLGKSIWDTASWGTELTWMQWLKVNQNEAVFKGRGNHNVTFDANGNCVAKATDSWCAYNLVDGVDKNYFALAFNFTPTWFQVKPGMDVLAPLSWSQGLYGNSAVTGGGQNGAGTFGLGVALDFYSRYRFDLKYVGFYGNYAHCNKEAASFCYAGNQNAVSVFNGTNAILSDRDFVALTFKTTF